MVLSPSALYSNSSGRFVVMMRGQFGCSEDAGKFNKSYHDPRKRLREVEFVMMERVQLSRVDHSNVNWSRSQHVCMKALLAFIITFSVFDRLTGRVDALINSSEGQNCQTSST